MMWNIIVLDFEGRFWCTDGLGEQQKHPNAAF